MDIKLFFPPAYSKHTRFFLNEYEIENIVSSQKGDTPLIKKQDRICRFCGKGKGETTFKNRAHLIPEFLGNKFLFSDFECDKCNSFFGALYEDQLTKMLGIYRTVSKIEGKAKIPTFKSKEVTARVKEIENRKVVVISSMEEANNPIKMDVESATITIGYNRNPFVPVMAYKALLKIALSVIDGNDIEENYKIAIDFLLNNSKKLSGGCIVTGYSLPFTCNIKTHIILWKKKSSTAKIASHVMALYFQNFVFVLPVPFNQNDIPYYKENFAVKIYPPIFLNKLNFEKLDVYPFMLDWFSSEKVVNELDELTIEIDKDQLAGLVAYDLKTSEIDPEAIFDPNSIAEIVIMDNPISITDIGNLVDRNTKGT